MPMTEAEARQKWCSETAACAEDSPRLAKGGYNCIGSRCMMWQWDNRGGADWQHLAPEAVEAFAKSSALTAPPPPEIGHEKSPGYVPSRISSYIASMHS